MNRICGDLSWEDLDNLGTYYFKQKRASFLGPGTVIERNTRGRPQERRQRRQWG